MRVIHGTKFTGSYPKNWSGYFFKEQLGYTSGRHTGVDYNYLWGDQDFGQPALAIAKGEVVYVGDKTSIGFGKTIIIRHTLTAEFKKWSGGKKYGYSRYMHLNKIRVRVGQKVGVGHHIGDVGKTGTKYAHLHVDLWTDKNGLGSHLQYHKDTQLDSYLDPYKTAEKWKNWQAVDPCKRYKDLAESRLKALKQATTALEKARQTVSELRTRPTRAELDKALEQVEQAQLKALEAEADYSEAMEKLEKQENNSINQSDWSKLWDKILSFFKKG